MTTATASNSSLRDRLDPEPRLVCTCGQSYEAHTKRHAGGIPPEIPGTCAGYLAVSMPAAPEGSAARVLDDEALPAGIRPLCDLCGDPTGICTSSVCPAALLDPEPCPHPAPSDGSRECVFCKTLLVTGYDANGEAADFEVAPTAPADTPIAPQMFERLYEPEMVDGKEVTSHQVRLGGSVGVGRALAADRSFWDSLHVGHEIFFRVKGVVGGFGYSPVKDKGGDTVGFVHERKVKAVAVLLDDGFVAIDSEMADELEELRLELKDSKTDRDEAVALLCDVRDAAVELVRLLNAAEGTPDASDEALEAHLETVGGLVQEAALWHRAGDEIGDEDDAFDAVFMEEPTGLDAALAEALS